MLPVQLNMSVSYSIKEVCKLLKQNCISIKNNILNYVCSLLLKHHEWMLQKYFKQRRHKCANTKIGLISMGKARIIYELENEEQLEKKKLAIHRTS